MRKVSVAFQIPESDDEDNDVYVDEDYDDDYDYDGEDDRMGAALENKISSKSVKLKMKKVDTSQSNYSEESSGDDLNKLDSAIIIDSPSDIPVPRLKQTSYARLPVAKKNCSSSINVFFKSHPLLRTHLLYPHLFWYYAAIILDLVLRYMWMVSLVPGIGPHMSLFLGTIEVSIHNHRHSILLITRLILNFLPFY